MDKQKFLLNYAQLVCVLCLKDLLVDKLTTVDLLINFAISGAFLAIYTGIRKKNHVPYV